MRILRLLLFGVTVIVAWIIIVATLSSPYAGPPSIQLLVTQTQNQLSQLHTYKAELEGQSSLIVKYLDQLDFVDNPVLFPNHTWINITSPIIATAVSRDQLSFVEGFVKTVRQISKKSTLFVYMLDLSIYEVDMLKGLCNDTCLLLPFQFSAFPAHVEDLTLRAYRPIIIQELLVVAGVVLWLDVERRLVSSKAYSHYSTTLMANHGISSKPDLVSKWLLWANHGHGIATWPRLPSLPTAALTHPNMFEFFHTSKEKYDFHQMSDAGNVLIVNSFDIHHQLMKPWVSCALTRYCISPIGAQHTGCRFDKKPLFRYSGCHLYDASALNVALGAMFSQDAKLHLRPVAEFVVAGNEPLLPVYLINDSRDKIEEKSDDSEVDVVVSR